MKNRFNLIDEQWIPVAGVGKVSLRDIFSESGYRALGGNPVQKISLLKLLLAIAQTACTPEDNNGWQQLGSHGVAEASLLYLERRHELFFLYGERPFLQFPAIEKAKVRNYGALLPEVATGNTSVLTQIQVERNLYDADKALLLITLMAFALAGKKTDNSVILSEGYRGKLNDKGNPSSGKPGPAVDYLGLLHSFLLGVNIQETLWINLFSHQQIKDMNVFPGGVGIAPWEEMPQGEDCPAARKLKETLMGRLIPMCRFCLLTNAGLHYTEGLAHLGYKDGISDPSSAVNYTGKVPKALWANPDKRPWRELTALLSFFEEGNATGLQSWQIRCGLERVRDVISEFAVWSGGLKVSRNPAGEQYVSGNDDFVESVVWLQSKMLGEVWFAQLRNEMGVLESLATSLYGRVLAFYKEQKMDDTRIAAQSTHLFWELCEKSFQELVNVCDSTPESNKKRVELRGRFVDCALYVYDKF